MLQVSWGMGGGGSASFPSRDFVFDKIYFIGTSSSRVEILKR